VRFPGFSFCMELVDRFRLPRETELAGLKCDCGSSNVAVLSDPAEAVTVSDDARSRSSRFPGVRGVWYGCSNRVSVYPVGIPSVTQGS